MTQQAQAQAAADLGTFDAAFIAQMSAQITAGTAALNRIGMGVAAANAFTAGLSPDKTESRSIMAGVVAELGQKQTEAITKIVYGALRVLRNRGVRIDRIIEDEIEEAVLEHTSRTTGLGDIPDTITAPEANFINGPLSQAAFDPLFKTKQVRS